MENAVLENVSINYNVETDGIVAVNKPSVIDYSTIYTTFEALEDGTFSFIRYGTGGDIQYSTDNGATWKMLMSGKSVSVVTGDKVMWKSTITSNSKGFGTFSSSNKFNVSGNIMSLLYGDDFKGQTSLEGKVYAFKKLFENSSFLIDAINLILPATTLAKYCYQYMFKDCSSLNHITMLATNASASGCLNYWVNNVSSTGTFVKHPDMSSLPTNYHGIPNGWTVENYQA